MSVTCNFDEHQRQRSKIGNRKPNGWDQGTATIVM